MSEELVNLVERDTDLGVMEKETTINMAADEKQLTVMSEKRTVVKSLLKHDHFEPTWFRIENGETCEKTDSVEEAKSADKIYAVKGKMPVGCLTVKSKPRSQNHQSQVVNSETVDPEAFA